MSDESEFWEGVLQIERAGKGETEAWLYEKLAGKVIESLEKNFMRGYYASDRKNAFSKIMEMIPQGATIGYGDSITLHQIGIISELCNGNYNFIDPWEKGIDGEESMERRRKALTADVFLSGTNAITLDGKLVCIDGLGNRVAALIFGPRKVIVATGANKIVKDAESGIKRVLELSTPLNAKRHNLNIPCGMTGVCAHCRDEWKICRHTVIIDGELPKIYREPHTHVVIVGEDLGF